MTDDIAADFMDMFATGLHKDAPCRILRKALFSNVWYDDLERDIPTRAEAEKIVASFKSLFGGLFQYKVVEA